MVIITLRRGDTVRIGENITVEVLDIDRNHAQLGITAPREVPIRRPGYVPTEKPKQETKP